MKIISSDWKGGSVKLRVDNKDDVWHLKNIVEEGDIVTAKTLRHVFVQREGRKEKVGRKLVKLSIEVEKVSYHPTTNKLRITGKIVSGPEDIQLGSYHSIEVYVGTVVTIEKKCWKRYHIERLKRAVRSVPPVLLVSVDFDMATFAMLKDNKLEKISEIENPYSLKEERQNEFYKAVAKEIEKFASKPYRVILAGPGFVKDHVYEIIKESYPKLSDKIIKFHSSSATLSGINEILRNGSLRKILKETRVVEEVSLVNDFFEHIAKDDGLACYGYKEVKKACEIGAVNVFLVSEEKIREGEVEELARSVEERGGRVEVISDEHEAGIRFSKMGGIGAILRFKVEQ